MTEFWVKKIYTPSGFSKINILGNKKALDVGCGGRKLPGAIGMDVRQEAGVDIVHDANKTPWPFLDNSFDLVLFNQSLEHLEDVSRALGEARRVLKAGGRVILQVPYFRSVDAFADVTHGHFFTSRSLDYILDFKFKIISFWYGWPHPSKNPIRQIFKNFIHRFPDFYDKYLSLLIPVECLTWELEVLK
ncbi:hypothetical protein A2757_00620 [Candidatus Giovannonibacteria bacterium RIFCSPHIGHO2_01_FULL_48_47]|nr:MAG: hypothetical protein A2757_00620 [Candidatus Giovannonibacteria bacterium RIFCSPHIGHO2_01_FULL_48_47]OGF68347.1 MAG: hypothetical protein A3D61_00490 [Candidatus Giovannonibacteria bacterium RIFCSPHIGHO2_02_FULL_48_15]OGF95523.1 MAG: hypothetical protein A2433_02210 [Candidatus Giovannonibacteria bacterium RIFOXYC1_FULL_48_8]OGF96199.1 MAG: hypothetical protein A2613_01360 [Candidatus Giovannonibacteria bacterium RIFOXYD1_FULL_48_21]HBT81649.1 hypothetical protein [Candidatus Giovannoni